MIGESNSSDSGSQQYSVSTEEAHGQTLYVLRDNRTGAHAKICPALGGNCVQLTLASPDGTLINIIDDEQHLQELAAQLTRFGIPVLYPWPSGIPEGRYAFAGKQYASRELHTDGNAWHGLVRTRAWEVVSHSASETGASLTCTVSTHLYPEMQESFPFPNSLTLTFTLAENALSVSAEVQNLGEIEMPFGFGLHPYFQVPLTSGGSRESCSFEVDAAKTWNWEALKRVASVDGVQHSALTNANPFAREIVLGNRLFNYGFTDLQKTNRVFRTRLVDPAAGLAVTLQATPDVRTLVVFSPQNRSVLCLEPWTCTANVFNLAEAGVEEAGLLVLGPGEKWNQLTRIGLESMRDD